MGLDDLLISTGVDQLIRLVKERGKVEMGEAAKALRTPLRTVEDWAHALEEEKLISIEYKLTKIYLVWQTPTSEYVSEKAGKLEAKATKTRGDVEGLLAKVHEGGEELSQMQTELTKLQSATKPATQGEVSRMKSELAELEKNYSYTIKSASEKLARLKKKVDALSPNVEAKKSDDAARELATLRKFEETLTSQLDENEAFFEALQSRLEELRGKIEEGGKDSELEELRGEIGELSALKTELAGELEAVSEEHRSVLSRLSMLDKKFEKYNKSQSLSSAKRKLSEIRSLQEEAKRQREAVDNRLSDSISLVKKQIASLQAMEGKLSQSMGKAQEIKEEYVDISEEVSKAGEELEAKRREVSERIGAQLSMLDKYKGGAMARFSKEELDKVSFLIRELSREQQLLEEKVKLLAKESEIVKMEASSAPRGMARPPAVPPVAVAQPNGAQGQNFVDKIRLSEEEEGEFERKREELRSLIRKMWEESKEGSS